MNNIYRVHFVGMELLVEAESQREAVRGLLHYLRQENPEMEYTMTEPLASQTIVAAGRHHGWVSIKQKGETEGLRYGIAVEKAEVIRA